MCAVIAPYHTHAHSYVCRSPKFVMVMDLENGWSCVRKPQLSVVLSVAAQKWHNNTQGTQMFSGLLVVQHHAVPYEALGEVLETETTNNFIYAEVRVCLLFAPLWPWSRLGVKWSPTIIAGPQIAHILDGPHCAPTRLSQVRTYIPHQCTPEFFSGCSFCCRPRFVLGFSDADLEQSRMFLHYCCTDFRYFKICGSFANPHPT